MLADHGGSWLYVPFVGHTRVTWSRQHEDQLDLGESETVMEQETRETGQNFHPEKSYRTAWRVGPGS